MMPWGFFRFEMNTHKPFSICGYSFQNGLGFQRDSNSFGSGSSNRGGECPVGWGIQRGQRSLGSGFQRRQSCLGGRHPMEGSTLRGRKNPMKPAVSWHTTLSAKSSVLYLWRPWVTERGCSGQEQALSVSHRTGGFCVLPDEKPRSLLKAESACSGVGGAAKWKGKAKRSLVYGADSKQAQLALCAGVHRRRHFRRHHKKAG